MICLPCEHTGGQLRVTHNGEDIFFDFAAKSSDNIQWAAFYSETEHEVLEVTSGHRVTLTYNLFVQERLGPFLGAEHIIARPDYYPLFKSAKDKLAMPDFLPKGTLILPCILTR